MKKKLSRVFIFEYPLKKLSKQHCLIGFFLNPVTTNISFTQNYATNNASLKFTLMLFTRIFLMVNILKVQDLDFVKNIFDITLLTWLLFRVSTLPQFLGHCMYGSFSKPI